MKEQRSNQTKSKFRCGTETVSFLASKIGNILPKDIKDSESRDIFKRKMIFSKEKSKHGFQGNAFANLGTGFVE